MQTTGEKLLATVPTVRPVLDQIANKWSVMILTFICDKPQRFNTIRRNLDGITQKALTEALRRLERNGLISRRVIPASPVAVEYSLTALGRSPTRALCCAIRVGRSSIGPRYTELKANSMRSAKNHRQFGSCRSSRLSMPEHACSFQQIGKAKSQ